MPLILAQFWQVLSTEKKKLLYKINDCPIELKADTHEGFCSRSMLQGQFAQPVHTRTHTAGACSIL